MSIQFKNVVLTAGIAAISMLAPNIAAQAQSNKTKTSNWYSNNKSTNSKDRNLDSQDRNSLKWSEAQKDASIKKDGATMSALQATGMVDGANAEPIEFGHNETEFAYIKRRLLGVSKGSQMVPSLESRIVNYLTTDTVLFDLMMKEFIITNEFVWRQKLKEGDTIQVLSHQESLPGMIDMRSDIYGQNAFKVVITPGNRKIIARELRDDIRFHGRGPAKFVNYPSEIMECELKGDQIFNIFTKAAKQLQYKLRAIELRKEQKELMDQKIALREQFMR